ncbi:MAG: ABC transporter ATP-binding protein [Actinomycetota bacterium]|nr:ABC transporter ATP-binding protein [Actinomycetota bacterium]
MALKKVAREIGIRQATETPAIELKNISKCFRLYHDVNYTLKERLVNWRKRGYDLFWALNDVDLTVYQGETLGIIGPNGSGKSTMLRLMTRIMSPNKGTIETHGTIAALLELGAGFHPDLTGRENIYLNASILGFKRRDLEGIFDEIVDFSELGVFIDNQVKNYSSGMYVRLGFSIAINLNPDILLIDEVLAVGDEAFQTKCLERIARMQQEGKTIVLVTHEADIAGSVCDRVLWLEKGETRMLGDPKGVTEAYHEAMRMRPEGSEFGTQDIFIDQVEILGREAREAVEFQTGDPMTIRLHYTARKPVEDPVFGFGFYDQIGFMVYGTNTRLRGIDIEKLEGEGRMDFHIPYLAMLDGRYYISVAAHTRDGLTNYHWLDKLYYFDVTSPGKEEGLITMECDVEITGD